MSSEINSNLTLSTIIPAKADTGLQTNSTAQTLKTNQNDVNGSLSLSSVKAATDQSSQLLQASKLSVEYSVDSSTKEVVMKVMDTDTGKLVRQIPSAEILDFVKRLQSLEDKQKGAVIQTRA